MEILIVLLCPLASYVLTKWLRLRRPRLALLPLPAAGLLFLMSWWEAVTSNFPLNFSDLYYGLLAVLIVVGWIAGAGGALKQYRPIAIILLCQYLVFYVFPEIKYRTDPIGTVVTMLILTFLLSAFWGIWCQMKGNLLYPLITAVLYLPSVPLHYEPGAVTLALWYLAVSALGLAAGVMLYRHNCITR